MYHSHGFPPPLNFRGVENTAKQCPTSEKNGYNWDSTI